MRHRLRGGSRDAPNAICPVGLATRVDEHDRVEAGHSVASRAASARSTPAPRTGSGRASLLSRARLARTDGFSVTRGCAVRTTDRNVGCSRRGRGAVTPRRARHPRREPCGTVSPHSLRPLLPPHPVSSAPPDVCPPRRCASSGRGDGRHAAARQLPSARPAVRPERDVEVLEQRPGTSSLLGPGGTRRYSGGKRRTRTRAGYRPPRPSPVARRDEMSEQRRALIRPSWRGTALDARSPSTAFAVRQREDVRHSERPRRSGRRGRRADREVPPSLQREWAPPSHR
jgi:hypothetical protein